MARMVRMVLVGGDDRRVIEMLASELVRSRKS